MLELYCTTYRFLSMVYCGKPSRGCQMCRSRRIKVPMLHLFRSSLLTPTIEGTRVGKLTRIFTNSVMRPNPPVINVRNLGDSVRDIKMTLTLCFATKLMPLNEEQNVDWIRRKQREEMKQPWGVFQAEVFVGRNHRRTI